MKMLPKIHRLPSRVIREVKKSGKRQQGNLVNVVVSRRSGPGLPSRWAIVVPARFFPKATERNRIKRSLREGVRRALPLFGSGFDLVMFANKSLRGKRLTSIQQELHTQLGSIKHQ